MKGFLMSCKLRYRKERRSSEAIQYSSWTINGFDSKSLASTNPFMAELKLQRILQISAY